jgi:hypothetical protein
MSSPLLSQSDKFFWHGYIDFYLKKLPQKISGTIVEFGVFKGNSIRWLLEQYPDAKTIYGADIIPYQSSWPIDTRVIYKQLDQNQEAQVHRFFNEIEKPSLIIEDGSHLPSHQSRCLKHGMNALESGGHYIIEDIQTSLPSHLLYINEFSRFRQVLQGIRDKKSFSDLFSIFKFKNATSLSVLLAIEQARRLGQKSIDSDRISILCGGSHFSRNEIMLLDEQIDNVFVYKRATFPMACHACGSKIFDYHSYRCVCGVNVFDHADSMAVLVSKR